MQHTMHVSDLELISQLSSDDLHNAVFVMSPDADLAGDLENNEKKIRSVARTKEEGREALLAFILALQAPRFDG